MKLTKKQIQEIKKLREEGLTQTKIAEKIGVSQVTISYWLSGEEKRKEKIRKECEKFRKKSKEERQKIYKKRRKYMREYRNKRYKEDEAFREYVKKISRESYGRNKNKQ